MQRPDRPARLVAREWRMRRPRRPQADRDKHVGSSVTRRDAEDQAFERRTRCERGEQSDRDAEPGEAEPFTQELADPARTKSHADQARKFLEMPGLNRRLPLDHRDKSGRRLPIYFRATRAEGPVRLEYRRFAACQSRRPHAR